MIFPQHKHGIGIFLKTGRQSQRDAIGIDGAGCGPGGINTDSADPGNILVRGDFSHHIGHCFQIIQGVLPETALFRIAVKAFIPSGIIANRGCDIFTMGIDEDSSDAVGSEIETDYKFIVHKRLFMLAVVVKRYDAI
jgi:hypothetical protein